MSGDGVVAHNRRTYLAENVDPTRTHLNIEYCYTPIEEAYHQLFDAALAEFNATQKRKDRCIENYFIPRCPCFCQIEEERQRKEKQAQRERMERIKRRRAHGLRDKSLHAYTFNHDNGSKPVMEKARAYVRNWKEAYRNNTGLLLFGDVGTGKSFFAGCIANELLDQDVPVLMTSFPTILNQLIGVYPEERMEFINSLNDYDLLSIDDLGVERSTEFAMEQMFEVIDRRYRCGKPMIITTNLTLEQLRNPPDLAHVRIYERILERCAPILFSGENFRKQKSEENKRIARMIVSSGA